MSAGEASVLAMRHKVFVFPAYVLALTFRLLLLDFYNAIGYIFLFLRWGFCY